MKAVRIDLQPDHGYLKWSNNFAHRFCA